ncbi:MAG: M3 family metallopeptidase [Gammaproteobacteria bacterium]
MTYDISQSPLLDLSDVPDFTQVTADNATAAIDHALSRSRALIESVLDSSTPRTFEAIVEPLEIMSYQFSRVWSPVSHVNSVMSNDELREAHNACLEKLTAFWSEVGQNQALYQAYKDVHAKGNLSADQKRLLDLALIDFELAGVGLDEVKRKEFSDIQLKLSALHARFDEHVLDCSNQWNHHTESEEELEGLPETALARAAQEAAEKDLKGWNFSLDGPAYIAVMSHAKNRELREIFYRAWATRASVAGTHDAKYDNTPVIEEILALRQQLAELLGYSDYAEYSLAKKMATSGEQVVGFIRDLAKRSKGAAEKEFAELQNFAACELEPWDVSFYAERLRQERFEISDEALRPYFPLEKALEGMFKITGEIFGITIRPLTVENAWHEDVRLFEVVGSDGKRAGRFFTDLFARAKKRGGAWMDECIGHNRIEDKDSSAVAYLVCNFMPPSGDRPALLTHSEIVTLFHEFGHTLHLLLSKVAYPGIAGINGVPWDAVELPSQFLENFAWQPDTLGLISGHFETGEPMPEELFQKLLGTRTFHAGLHSVRQLEFALFDMRLHREQPGAHYEQVLKEVRDEVSVIPVSADNHFANAFSHIFAGGYAAGYYSYKWAEVLSADAFSAFEDTGILDQPTGERFRNCILEKGGSVDAMEAFKRFRGREPTVDALIRHNGLDLAS